ncbi:MAG TPA: TIGR04282 family arsenosugar biosynthesis glycosyltransferase [Polyangiaceae bacterium]
MARAPTPGHCKTRLSSALDPIRAAALYRAMLLDTLDAMGRVSGIRKVVLAAPEYDGVSILRSLVPPSWEVMPQRGTGLGERLTHGFADLAAPAVVLVSSDSPTLPVAALAAAFESFSGRRRALLGPCEDGGYYLIGLTTPQPGVLRDIAWSTPLVLEQTRERMRELGLECHELPVAYDVDTPADLERFRAELSHHPELAPRCATFFADQP